MKTRTLTTVTLLALVALGLGWLPTPAGAASGPTLTAPRDAAHAVELARAWLTKRLAEGYQSVPYVGEKRPQVATAKAGKELPRAFVVELTTTPHIHPMEPGSAKHKSMVYHLVVAKKTGRIAFDEIVPGEPLISQYASFARCAAPLLSLLNRVFVPGHSNGSENFSARAFGSGYHCLLPFFGQRILGVLPVEPRADKLPAWAQKEKAQLANGMRVYMFPAAFPARFWAENAVKAQAAGDADLITVVRFYPQFAMSLGVSPDEKVKPLKLEGWAQHGALYAQDTRERLAAGLLLQMGDSAGLKTAVYRLGTTDVFLIGKGHATDTFFATFDATSIHHEINYGRPVAGKLTPGSKSLPSLAQLIAEGDAFALSVARKHAGLRGLLQEAAAKDAFAAKAVAMVAEF